MANALDPYSFCPCGSGKKLKFCCQDMATEMQRIHEMLEGNEPESIELIGLCTDICVISNALLVKAFYPESTITVDAAACAGATPEGHKTALSAMKACQIDIVNE